MKLLTSVNYSKPVFNKTSGLWDFSEIIKPGYGTRKATVSVDCAKYVDKATDQVIFYLEGGKIGSRV